VITITNMKITNHKLYAWLIIIMAFVLIFSYFYMNRATEKSSGEIRQHEEEVNWKVYTNKQYDFEITFPSSWHLYEDFSTNSPIINLYPQKFNSNPPFNHFSSNPHVSIFPNGLPMDGVVGDQVDVTNNTDLFPNVEVAKTIEFILENNDSWAVMAQFLNTPDSWQSWGYLWARKEVGNYEEVCIRNNEEITPYECNIFDGDQIKRLGQVNVASDQIILEIIKSFKFLN
jgi:hypothetical protein